MKANLEIVNRIWSQKGSPLGNVIFEGDFERKIVDFFENVQKTPRFLVPEYCIRLQNQEITVTRTGKNEQIFLFSQKLGNAKRSQKKTRRHQTLANQKNNASLENSLTDLLEYLDGRECDWIFSLLLRPTPCNSTNFARLFGYNSFFHRWFNKIQKKMSKEHFTKWKKYFQEIYHDNHLKMELYWTLFYISLICTHIIDVLSTITEYLECDIKKSFHLLDSLTTTFFPHAMLKDNKLFNRALKKALTSIISVHPPDIIEDILNLFYQELVTFTRRHTLGEFYTNVELSKEMVSVGYSMGDSVLDPCCGSGTFLIEIYNSIIRNHRCEGISKLYGLDIHPISVTITKINILFAFLVSRQKKVEFKGNWRMHLETLLSHIKQGDYLFDSNKKKYDFVIGNPPWIVINSINSMQYKEKLKSLARSMHISTDTQNVSNLEISSLFLEKTSSHHMKPGSKLLLIVSAGILNGSQNERVRRFNNLKQVKIWSFNEDLFNVHNICIQAEFGDESLHAKYRVQVLKKGINFVTKSIYTLSTQVFLPTYIVQGGNFLTLSEMENLDSIDWGVGRFIPEQRSVLTVQKSEYHDEFRQGACIGPRNLLFVMQEPSKEFTNLQSIYPDPLQKSKKYGGWDYKAYDFAKVEKCYIHNVLKSTELIPFAILRFVSAFLPLRNDFRNAALLDARKKGLRQEDFDTIFGKDTHAKDHYFYLHSNYSKSIKSGGAISDLFVNMNYNNKLLRESQQQREKVVYNGIGSNVKAAFVQQDAIVDSSLYYFIPKTIAEAHYLVGVLNSSSITEFTRSMGSTGAGGSLRNIHKNPLKCNILKYRGTPKQKLIAKLAKSLETYVIEYCVDEIYSKLKNILKKEFCLHCGEFFKSISTHVCKDSKKLYVHNTILQSLTVEEKTDLENRDTIRKMILQENDDTSSSLKSKVSSILALIIKPKTLQNQLRRDELYKKKMKVLDVAVKSLWK